MSSPVMPDQPTPEQIAACRREYGDAHDVQVAFSGECAWCGFYDPSVQEGHIDDNGNIYDAHGNLLERHFFQE